MGKRSREKGKAGEREWAAFLREHLGVDARRGVQYQGGPDSPDVVGVPGIHFEVKRVERLNLHAAMCQADDESRGSDVPVVAHRHNRRPWLVTLPATCLVEFATAILSVADRKETGA